jgi:hypothetical protein
VAVRSGDEGHRVGEATMTCSHCGAPMKLINSARARLLLYWCPTCQRFAEVHKRGYRGRQLGPDSRL